MANKPKRQPESSRRATVEALRREQKRQERRKTMLIVGVAALIGALIIGGSAFSLLRDRANDPKRKAVASFGVAADEAGCTEVTTIPESGQGDHVPVGQPVDYGAEHPPVTGRHAEQWAQGARKFYTREDRPQLEQLLHNMEHGYTIVWYDGTIKGEQLEALEGLSERVPREREKTVGKFIVAPYGVDDREKAFPNGKHIALTHWGAQKKAYRQYCSSVSGEAVEKMITAHPYTDSPEPQGG